MKRFYGLLLANLLTAVLFGFVTYRAIHILKSGGEGSFLGFWNFTPVGLGASTGLVLFVTLVFAVDFFWLALFLIWLVKQVAHIRSNDNSLRLP